MKTILSTLNAKYIHTSLALRWLYVANKGHCDISFREYTIKETTEVIAQELLATNSDILGLSVYIWNVNRMGELIVRLKQRNPDLIIIVGGPEVSYEPEHFLGAWPIDYVISGEGEFVLGELIHAIENGGSTQLPGVSSKEHLSATVLKADLEQLARLPSPYQLGEDKESLANRMVYFETSRGCPYHCQYCLSSLEKGVRYFPKGFIEENLRYLIDSGARQIKFLDRTFNLDKKHTQAVFDFLIEHRKEHLSCQFEVYADLLTDQTIDYLNTRLPGGYFRFEVGIQSTYQPTNLAVKRKQDFDLLASNIRKLMEGGKITLHLDLIAGLPHETFQRFVQSFNDVFALRAKELQLGFLKMLRGTNLRKEAARYGYTYQQEAPYEILSNADIAAEELLRIHRAETMLDKYWNSGRFILTMDEVFAGAYSGKYFEFFDELGQFHIEKNYKQRGYQLEDLFVCLHQFLVSKGMALHDSLRRDYYNNFTLRPQGYWDKTIDKHTRKKLLRIIGEDKDFLWRHKLTRRMMEKQTAINPADGQDYLLTVFRNDGEGVVREEIVYHLHPRLII